MTACPPHQHLVCLPGCSSHPSVRSYLHTLLHFSCSFCAHQAAKMELLNALGSNSALAAALSSYQVGLVSAGGNDWWQ